MRILVTGSSGTIGTRLVERLLEKGHEVIGVDREPNKWQSGIQDLTLCIDLLHERELAQIPTDIDLIIHLAANARVYELVEHPERARDNLLTTFNILEFARKNRIAKFIFASSRETYGNIHIHEERYGEEQADFSKCESPYTASKIGGEALVEAYKRCYKMDAIIFRFSNVYGMYDDSIRVVPLFIRQAQQNQPLVVYGKDKCLDFTFVDDCIDGIVLGIEKFEQAKNGTYNLAFGEGVTLVHLAERIKELLKSSSQIEISSPRTGEVIRYVADISRAKKVLGFAPQTPFDRGIERTVEWYRAQ